MGTLGKWSTAALGVVFAASSLAAPVASAQTASISLQAQLDALASLTAQIKTLQGQRQEAMVQLASQLRQGVQGDNVKILQALLASDASIYPEGLVTGYFGPATHRAVKRFQKKHGLSQVGNVGPLTLAKINLMLEMKHEMRMSMGTSTKVKGFDDFDDWKKEKEKKEKERDDDDRDDNDHKGNGRGLSTDCATMPPGHFKAEGWLKKRGGIAFIMKNCTATTTPPVATTTPPVATSTPDVIPPVISAVVTSGIASTSAFVAWTTNENATGKVYYGTSSPLVMVSASFLATTTLQAAHSFALSGLTASTTYSFVLESADAAGNKATTSPQSFVTTQ